MPEFHSLLYRSRATRALDERELLPILMASLRNNARAGVTGVLLYGPPEPLPEPEDDDLPLSVVPFEGPGVFVQWLEGPHDAVQQTYERIGQDPRHTDVEVITTGTRTDRLFPVWAMALETVRQLPESESDIVRLAEVQHAQIL